MSAASEALTCPVCYTHFDIRRRKPIDLGCGHAFCETCTRSNPSSFRVCPECRRPSRNPHVSYGLLRVVEQHAGQGAAAGDAAGGSGHDEPSEQQQGEPPAGVEELPAPPPSDGWLFGQPSSHPRQHGLSEWWRSRSRTNTHTPHPSPSTSFGAGPSSGLGASVFGTSPRGPSLHLDASIMESLESPHSIASSLYNAFVPILTVLYVMSPLDVIPDIIPLVGWLDDFMIIIAFIIWLMQYMSAASAQQAR